MSNVGRSKAERREAKRQKKGGNGGSQNVKRRKRWKWKKENIQHTHPLVNNTSKREKRNGSKYVSPENSNILFLFRPKISQFYQRAQIQYLID